MSTDLWYVTQAVVLRLPIWFLIKQQAPCSSRRALFQSFQSLGHVEVY